MCVQWNLLVSKTTEFKRKPQLLRRRQIHCHFHPFEELHILMGKVPEIIKPNSSTEPWWSKKAEEKKCIYMYINVGGISAVRVFQQKSQQSRKIQGSTFYRKEQQSGKKKNGTPWSGEMKRWEEKREEVMGNGEEQTRPSVLSLVPSARSSGGSNQILTSIPYV